VNINIITTHTSEAAHSLHSDYIVSKSINSKLHNGK